MSECYFCKKNKTILKNYFKKIFNSLKKNKKKKIFNYFILLNFSLKILLENNIFIPFYSEELKIMTRNKVNNIYSSVGYICCNHCNKYSFPSHFLWSNFYNGKCSKCSKLISVCGWCNKNYCNKCS